MKYISLSLRSKAYHYLYKLFRCTYSKYVNLKLEKHYRYNSYKLKKLKDIHKGQRCFIIGTGPSLNKTNLSLIKNEIVFGVNTLYRGLSEFGIKCNYYAVSDEDVWKSHFKNILDLNTVLLLSTDAGKEYLSNLSFYQKFQKNEPIVIRELGEIWSSGWLIKDLSIGTYWGATVIIDLCLQAAYYMGFKKVYLLGCDCDYSRLHRFNGLKTEALAGGVVEDWSKVFTSYEICKKAYEEDGKEIINASVGGKLEIFKRKKLERIV